MIERIKTYLLIGLSIFIAVGWFYVNGLEKSRDALLLKTKFLANHLDKQVVVSGNLITQLERAKKSVKIKYRYLPPEGTVKVNIPKKKEGEVVVPRVIYKTKGFTFRPGVGVYYNEKIVPTFSSKVFYWGRMGAVVNVNHEGLAIGVSRYIDDAFPIWRPKNTEIFITYMPVKFRDGVLNLQAGLRITF